MKTTLTPLIFIFLLLTFSCSKEEDCNNPVDCLPSATQIGKNTAGCLIDGKIFLPGGESLNSGSALHSQYLVYEGKYIFSLTIINFKDNIHLIQIGASDVELIKNKTYELTMKSDITVSGKYTIGGGLIDGFSTNNETNGELTITNLNLQERIISGTFWFDARNGSGEKVEIREGRFDVRYQ